MIRSISGTTAMTDACDFALSSTVLPASTMTAWLKKLFGN
jgi:hypothetical protein